MSQESASKRLYGICAVSMAVALTALVIATIAAGETVTNLCRADRSKVGETARLK